MKLLMFVIRYLFERENGVCMLAVVHIIIILSCNETAHTVDNVYRYTEPNYDLVELKETTDTVTFSLNENTYNVIKSFNIFSQGKEEYISFYDRRSESINIYHFQSGKLLKKIILKSFFPGEKLFKTTVYIRNFDSVFINTRNRCFLFDSSGRLKGSAAFLEDPPNAWAKFENTNPPVVKEGLLYASTRPYVKETSLEALRQWKLLYRFDMENDKASLCYPLPVMYQENIYGYHFLDYSYCYNNRNNFVFSFPADSNIYETDLTDYHVAYYAKSRRQADIILPVSKDTLEDNEGNYRSYLTRDSYGPIYFDPYRKRYLRVAKSGISMADYQAKNWEREQRLIIFDEHCRIIGESSINKEVILKSIFFTANGGIYARVNPRDEYGLHFVRLVYNDLATGQLGFSGNK
ncbi:DUF4221 family protein [Chitinophaga japonensis]|nr:DUF4221 family protein [Chitinophaga japonensis]